MALFKVGLGFDVHPFSESRPLILCGVNIPSTRGLLGHSDGDVGIHALMDAILGACGFKDIGHFFPPNEQWRGASSLKMLRIVREKAEEKGLILKNADISLIIEEPKISPYIEKMIYALKSIFPEAQFSVKATTAEGLGSIGRGEGAVALAIVLLEEVSHG